MNVHHFADNILPQKTADCIVNQLRSYLYQGETLLLLSGGSVARDVYPFLAQALVKLPQLKNLMVALVDERFGEEDHQQSNMGVVTDSGLTSVIKKYGGKVVFPLALPDVSKNIYTVATAYNKELKKLFTQCQYALGILGIGADGHTAGIKPQLNRETFDTLFPNDLLAVGYVAKDFARITITPAALTKLTQIIAYARGQEKQLIIKRIQSQKSAEVYKYPTLLLKSHLQVDLFTDQ